MFSDQAQRNLKIQGNVTSNGILEFTFSKFDGIECSSISVPALMNSNSEFDLVVKDGYIIYVTMEAQDSGMIN